MRLIDADLLIDEIRHDVEQTPDSDWGYGLNHSIPIVRNQPTVDAIPVVMCKDCKFADPYINPDKFGRYGVCDCDNRIIPRADFYCADGEK